MKTRIKICCIMSPYEAEIAVRFGASAVGLVSKMPSGPGIIDEDEIALIASGLPPAVASFLLTSETNPQKIIEQQNRTATNTLQLCDTLDIASYKELASNLPGINLVQVVHVVDETSIEAALFAAPYVQALLLDSGSPKADIRELGGTGRIHNWEISCRIRELTKKPVFLAGGLTSENVVDAIKQVHPFGVDVCSGVRSDGLLDKVKLENFINAVENAA